MHPHFAFSHFRGKRVHLGLSGSVAVYKSVELLRAILKSGMNAGATLTGGAQRFITPLTFEALGALPVFSSMDNTDEGIFGHLEPGQDADAFCVAPATANILAKAAHGIADDMLSCQLLAADCPIILAPAMNPRMWNAPATQENWAKLKSRANVTGIEPCGGLMACGDTGKGRFPAIEEIYLHILRALSPQDMAGQNVLVTLGPTREAFDAVRFWTNPSSGTMGASVALAAWLRGADVTAICGPVHGIYLPSSINRVDVSSAQQMYDAVHEHWASMDIGCLTAAVADFYPEPYGDQKFKKTGKSAGLDLHFNCTPDILRSLGEAKASHQRLIGFAAETADVQQYAEGKLKRKNLDLIVGNDISRADSGFGSATNAVVMCGASGKVERHDAQPKPDIAWRIWDWMLDL